MAVKTDLVRFLQGEAFVTIITAPHLGNNVYADNLIADSIRLSVEVALENALSKIDGGLDEVLSYKTYALTGLNKLITADDLYTRTRSEVYKKLNIRQLIPDEHNDYCVEVMSGEISKERLTGIITRTCKSSEEFRRLEEA